MSCPNCIKGGVLPDDPTGTTSFQNAYFAAAAPGGSPSKHAVLLLTDVCGLAYANPKVIADRLAKRLNCDVWVPDYFNGTPIFKPESLDPPPPAGTKLTWKDWMKFLFLGVTRGFYYYKNRPSVVINRLKEFIPALQQEKKYEKIGAVGYCFGGGVAVAIGATELVHSLVVCHPALTFEHIKGIKVPTSWVCAEDDFTFPGSMRDKAEAIFAARKDKADYVPYEFITYEGTTHGFACRPDLSNSGIVESFEKGFEQTAAWFEKTLST